MKNHEYEPRSREVGNKFLVYLVCEYPAASYTGEDGSGHMACPLPVDACRRTRGSVESPHYNSSHKTDEHIA